MVPGPPLPSETRPRFRPYRSLAPRPPRFAVTRRLAQHGQGSVEFLLAAVPMLLIGLTSIEAIHWHFTRQAVSLALSQAARVAITRHADPAALDDAFAAALLPLYASVSPTQAHARLERAMGRRERATGLPAWRLRIRSPSVATFHDFASHDPELRHLGPPAVIDNDYLNQQHRVRLAQGWPDGRGPASGQNTLEANTLVVHLTWLHEPLLPGVRNLLRQLAPSDSRYGSVAMARSGYLPIHREVAFVMQSHAVAWNMPGHGRVLRLAGTGGSQATGTDSVADGPPPAESHTAAPCTGSWCLTPIAQYVGSAPPPHTAAGASSGAGNGSPGTAGFPPATDQRDAADPTGRGDAPPWETDPVDCPGCCG